MGEKCLAAKTLKLSSGFTAEAWNAAYENTESAEYKELEARLLAKILADLTAAGVNLKSGSIQILSVSASAVSPPAASPNRRKRDAATQHTVVSYVIVAFYNPETTNEAALTSSIATASGATVEVTDNTCSCAFGTAKTGADCDASKSSSNQCSTCSEGYTLNTTTESCDKDVVAAPVTTKPATEERSEDDEAAEGQKEAAGSAGSSLVVSLILIFVTILI